MRALICLVLLLIIGSFTDTIAEPVGIPGKCFGATLRTNPDGSFELKLTCCCVFNEVCATVDKGPFSPVNPATQNGPLVSGDYLKITLSDGTEVTGEFISHCQTTDPSDPSIQEHTILIAAP